MQSIGLVFKAFWAPAEAMFLTAKNPRVFGHAHRVGQFLAVGLASFTRIDFGDMVRQQLEKTQRGQSMPEEQKQSVVRIYRTLAPVIVVAGALLPAPSRFSRGGALLRNIYDSRA